MLDFSPIIGAVWGVFGWLIPVFLVAGLIKSPWFKGKVGELFVKLVAKLRLPQDTYIPLHDITLLTPDGTTQIDHAFVSRYGIFVVETKNMKGWIFGSERQAQWTQKIFKQSIKFQNPLRQNYKHVKALEAALDIPLDKIHSVIAFVGDSRFKTPMPANVTAGSGYIRYIKSFQEVVFSDSEVSQLVATIAADRLPATLKTHRQHVQHLKARSTSGGTKICPKCGGSMVLRTVKKGANAGSPFWGCAAFPSCRGRLAN